MLWWVFFLREWNFEDIFWIFSPRIFWSLRNFYVIDFPLDFIPMSIFDERFLNIYIKSENVEKSQFSHVFNSQNILMKILKNLDLGRKTFFDIAPENVSESLRSRKIITITQNLDKKYSRTNKIGSNKTSILYTTVVIPSFNWRHQKNSTPESDIGCIINVFESYVWWNSSAKDVIEPACYPCEIEVIIRFFLNLIAVIETCRRPRWTVSITEYLFLLFFGWIQFLFHAWKFEMIAIQKFYFFGFPFGFY